MKNPITLLVVLLITSVPALAGDLSLILKGEHRTPEFAERDPWRHPAETLEFFQVASNQVVVEIWPGRGWYTEILAPFLKGEGVDSEGSGGRFYAAHFPTGVGVDYFDRVRAAFTAKLEAGGETYSGVIPATFDPGRDTLTVPDGSVDRVLTFRNVHNWLRSDSEQQAFRLFFKVLKPGGVLGVVEHRAQPGTDRETMLKSGYMTEQYVIELAQNAGFELEATSEINANPRDTTDHPAGVWTLPPTLRLKDENRDKYLAIGESDRMTLRFRKPQSLEPQ